MAKTPDERRWQRDQRRMDLGKDPLGMQTDKATRNASKLNTTYKGKNPKAEVKLSFTKDVKLTAKEKNLSRKATVLFGDAADELAVNQDRIPQYNRNRSKYIRLSNKVARAERHGNNGKVVKLQGKIAGLTLTEQGQREEVRDQHKFDKTIQFQSQYLEVMGEAQRLQTDQAVLIEQGLREQNKIFQDGVRQQTSLQRELLAEQQKQADILDQRAKMEEVRAAEQNRLQAIEVSQQGLLQRGRSASLREQRRSSPTTRITARSFG